MTHPIRDLDDLVQQGSRLGILVMLSEGGRVQFSLLQDSLGLTEGNLSRHLTTLEAAGYVAIEKGYEGRRPVPGPTSQLKVDKHSIKKSPPSKPLSPSQHPVLARPPRNGDYPPGRQLHDRAYARLPPFAGIGTRRAGRT